MGGEGRPGSGGPQSGGLPDDVVGVGDYDPVTGLYESYEARHRAEQGASVSFDDVLAERDLLISDFASEYGIRLAQVLDTLPWREFTALVAGLFACDSRLYRRFRVDDKPTGGGDDD